jgi:hypothetical protein
VFAGGDAQLPLDQIQAGDHLGDRMLDLQARVDLHEVEIARRRADDELDRAGIARSRSPCARPHRGGTHARAAPARGKARAIPRAPSGSGAAPSIRVR